jgi:hypothetical protein
MGQRVAVNAEPSQVPVRIAVVIPTRNRQPLAMKAVQSLLDQAPRLDIVVCDNSTSPGPLQDFCRGRPSVHYLRPPAELSMPANWDYAVRTAMEMSPATHFSVHYDRKLSKPGAWAPLARLAGRFPDRLITFGADVVAAHPPPLRLWQTPWTGGVYAIGSAKVAQLLATGHVGRISHLLPIFSNCLVPRPILERIVGNFGDLCDSTGPDSAFMWRFLAFEPGYLHLDRPMGIYYASHRSTGVGYLRNEGGDFPDFMKTYGERQWLEAAPVPGLNLGQNLLYHEHELVRRRTGDRLPPLDRAAVLDDMAGFLQWVADPELKDRFRALLRENGWTGSEPEPYPPRAWRSVAWEMLTRLRMKAQGFDPPHICGFSFRSDEKALDFALRYPRRPEPSRTHLELVEPEAIES